MFLLLTLNMSLPAMVRLSTYEKEGQFFYEEVRLFYIPAAKLF